jgi:hypothetical protein
LRPPTGTATVRVLVPEPTLTTGLLAPYEVVVPYSKYALVPRPFGLTRPFNVAPVGPMLDAELVETAGAGLVVNDRLPPMDVPASLEATSR